MKIFLLVFAFVVLSLMPVNILAADYSNLNFIGFSKDGKYLAFEEYGTQDGSGFPFSTIFFIDVVKNSYAAPPVKKLIEKETAAESSARILAKTASAANLKKFGIIQGNTGKLVVARLSTDLNVGSVSENGDVKDQPIKFTDRRDSGYFENEFELWLKTSEVTTKGCDSADQPVLKFELTLKNVRADTEKTLQKDETLPPSRYCPFEYTIQNVYVYENKIAVFLNVYTPGFEGPDMRYLVVTGAYK